MSRNKPTLVTFNPPYFGDRMKHRGGVLTPEPEVHALYYYAVVMTSNLDIQKNALILEGDKDPTIKSMNLLKSIALLYGVQPEHMVKCWDIIDMQFVLEKIQLIPAEYRFDQPYEIRKEIIQ